MAITTRIAPFYGGQKLLAFVLCALFGAWGAYDYFIKIPKQEIEYKKFEDAKARLIAVDGARQKVLDAGGKLNPEQEQALQTAKKDLEDLAPGGSAPVQPSKFNRATQWFYMACLPFAPYFLWLFAKAKRQRYTLEDDGTLTFAGDPQLQTGQWTPGEITDIDMNRWMAKSIAYLVHKDGTRLTLDAYLHKDLHLIIGALASKMYPDQWDNEARQIKPPESADGMDRAAAAETDKQTTADSAA